MQATAQTGSQFGADCQQLLALGHPLSESDTKLSDFRRRKDGLHQEQVAYHREGQEVDSAVHHSESEPTLSVSRFFPKRHGGKLVFFDTLHLENVLGTILTVNGIADTVSSRNHIERLTLTVLSEIVRPKATTRQTQA